MKKHLAVLLIAIMAVSVLSTAGVVAGASGSTVNPTATPISAPTFNPAPEGSPNPLPTNAPGPGAAVKVKLQVSQLVVLPQSKQVILVTILYDKKNFDPLMYGTESFAFGLKGTEASPVAYYTTDVNRDGYKDLTLVFNAKDTGLKFLSTKAKLTGSITFPSVCSYDRLCVNKLDSKTSLNSKSQLKPVCLSHPICEMYQAMPISVTGTASVLAL
jgi:hypothetical protein